VRDESVDVKEEKMLEGEAEASPRVFPFKAEGPEITLNKERILVASKGVNSMA